jgi:endonuclease/exonuclease/phosphatase family metal-dependent hydrolase
MAMTFAQWRNVIVINKPSVSKKETIKILTFNTHIFNNHNDNGFKQIAEFIKESDADIVCLQEFGYFYRYGASKKEILKFIDSIYPYRHLWFKNQHKWGENGLATFSRYPIVKKKKIEYQSADNISIYSDIVIDGDTIRVINNHLESNKLNQEDREIAKKIMADDNSRQEKIDAGLKVGSRLVSGAKNRVKQVEAVRSTLDETDYKTIVLGDFNDVPLSYTYNKICGNLQDAYALGGKWGYHWTYNKSAMLFAIDHILVDKNLDIIDSKVHHEMKISDHYPVSCVLQIK